jgi:hypothetical protein
MEHDGASVETISVSANSHGIRTLEAAPTAYLAMMRKVAVVSMNSAFAADVARRPAYRPLRSPTTF